jgi:hypothetical protein
MYRGLSKAADISIIRNIKGNTRAGAMRLFFFNS